MKRIGNLFERIIEPDNISLAHQKARKGKSHYAEVMLVESNLEYYLGQVHEMLKSKTFATSQYRTKVIYEPKVRTIYKLPYHPDRIVQHAIMNIIQPIWDKVFIPDCYSAIPGRGLHAGLFKLRQFLKDREHTKYCLKFDVKQFYPSMSHDVLLSLIQRKIKCPDTLWLLEDIVKSPGGDRNAPIGNYLSQYFANIYLNWFDHWLKEVKQCRYYIRYGDDGVILHRDKSFLRILLDEIREYLDHRLKLELHRKTQVFPVDDRGIDFLGYRSFRDYTLLRKSSAKRFKRKIHLIQHCELKPEHIISSVMSYLGWLKHCNSYHLLRKCVYASNIPAIVASAAKELEINNPMRFTYVGQLP